MDVHYSSGLYNRAFYTLGTTDGWTVRKAFDVMVKANMDYWTSNSTFADGACGAMKAAKELGYDAEAVKNAFTTVGIKVNAGHNNTNNNSIKNNSNNIGSTCSV